ncbi:MAG: ABC transporter permease [Acidobacteria bacterium]|nr:ABC transporter permease [Acidobacteriota bacterium]
MRTYITYTKTSLKLMLRDKAVLFFNYLMPLIFFVAFAQIYRADKGGEISQVISMVLIIGVLGSGFFGAGMRAVQEREQNILRRFKVAPITPMPILVSSLLTGLIAYLPSVLLILGIAHFYYHMPWPRSWLSLLVFQALALVAFRSMGGIVAAVVNSMQESQIIIQILYLPMLFLSGATVPVSILPAWIQVFAQFLPASYLYTGLTGILVRKETLLDNLIPAGAMIATMFVATFLASKLFRWEKEEKLPAKAKLWLVAVMVPFLTLGSYQAYSKDNVSKAKLVMRDMRRNRTLLLRGPRIILPDGKQIASGGLLLKNGQIAEIFPAPPPENYKAEIVEATGKTVMPGLIDMHVHLLAPGGPIADIRNYKPDEAVARALAAYLYSGVTAVKSVGDGQAVINQVRATIDRGDKLGAELFYSGKMFTTEKGHGTEYFKGMPDSIRQMAEKETLYLPKSAEEARAMVRQQKQSGAAGIKAILEAGQAGMVFNRMDVSILKAIGEEAKAQGLPLSVHTGDARDVADAVASGASVVEHGSARDAIPDSVFAQMARKGVAYDPTLTVLEAFRDLGKGQMSLLERTLIQQVSPEGLILSLKKFVAGADGQRYQEYVMDLNIANDNLLRAWKAGVPLVTGSDAGNFMVIHGPTVHRELQLWVKAGIPAPVALAAATAGSAKALGIGSRAGSIRVGYDATVLLLDGNPLDDITATERLSGVYFKGERVDRAGLFEKD